VLRDLAPESTGGVIGFLRTVGRFLFSKVSKAMTLEFMTFLLAVVGYTGLAASTVAATANARIARSLTRATAAVVVAHVVMVWSVRYNWSFDRATRNGLAPFAIFHTALILIVLAAFARQRIARRLLQIAFPVVTLGAIGAVFSDAAVTRYRVPVIVVAVLGVAGLVFQRFKPGLRQAPG
jgi:hypothetical protein